MFYQVKLNNQKNNISGGNYNIELVYDKLQDHQEQLVPVDDAQPKKGYEEDLQFIKKYKVSLYPARYSVGLKSKVIESWLHHTTVVTSPIGAEGMFFEMIEAKYAIAQTQHDSGFVNECEFTPQEKDGQSKLKSYYSANSLASNHIKKLSFGGSHLNYSYLDFAQSAVELYTNKQKWEKGLKIGYKTILKNQNYNQLEINLRQALLQMQMAVYKTRGDKTYDQEWKRVMKNKEYQKKIHPYP